MSLLQKLFISKKEVAKYIDENGMEQAVKKYGINKLCDCKIITSYNGTELFHDDISFEDKVYDKTGKFLGTITDLMCPFYREAGCFFGPCTNGNIILCNKDNEEGIRSYGVFDKTGKQLVEYGKYFDKCFLPNGVALISGRQNKDVNVTTVTYGGEIMEQDYTHIKECFIDKTVGTNIKSYKTYKSSENQVIISMIHLNKNGEEVEVDNQNKIEKGID